MIPVPHIPLRLQRVQQPVVQLGRATVEAAYGTMAALIDRSVGPLAVRTGAAAGRAVERRQHALDKGQRVLPSLYRAALTKRLVAFEDETGVRLGIQETQADPSYSAFRSTTSRDVPGNATTAARLVKTMTGK